MSNQPVNNNSLHVLVMNKDGALYDEEADAVTSYNKLGVFDILPMHENFISLIRDQLIIHKGRDAKKIDLKDGIIKVKDNQIKVYLGIQDMREPQNSS